VAQRLMARWGALSDPAIDVRQEMMRFTADVTTLLAFGQDLNSVERPSLLQEQIEVIFGAVARRILTPLPWVWKLPLPEERRADRAAAQVRERVLNMIRGGGKTEVGETLLDAMLEAQDDDRFTEDEVFGNVFTLLLAGEDTTANSLAWMVYYLACNPELQERVRAEARDVLGDEPVPSTLEQVGRLKLTLNLFKEVLRLRSPAQMIFLTPNRDTELGGHPIAKDELVVVLTGIMSEREENFTRAHELLPERWDPAFRDAHPGWNHRHQAFLPFGGGPRTCPGAQLAGLEAQTVIAAMCTTFAFEFVGDPGEVDEEFHFIMHPTPFKVRLRPL